jgi:hypothetical protein
MKRALIPAVVVASFMVLLTFGSTADACITKAQKYALTDCHLPVTTGAYDPCDNWLKWDYEFNRNDNEDPFTIIAFEVVGAANSLRIYDSRVIHIPDSYHYWGYIYVGPSTENVLNIWKYDGTCGHFYSILGTATYYNSQPTGPEHDE